VNPTLEKIHLRARSDPYLDGVAEGIMAHGDASIAQALESMLVRVVEILGRLIGEDMALMLIERSQAAADLGNAAADGSREEA
jgi:hypothetical protein